MNVNRLQRIPGNLGPIDGEPDIRKSIPRIDQKARDIVPRAGKERKAERRTITDEEVREGKEGGERKRRDRKRIEDRKRNGWIELEERREREEKVKRSQKSRVYGVLVFTNLTSGYQYLRYIRCGFVLLMTM